MGKFKITIECDEWWVADSLHELASHIENDDLLDDMWYDGKVEVSLDHCTATIKESE